jgi:antitoxin (DNA-binding transcriptional repressor) of toxin-antitoxin stability system
VFGGEEHNKSATRSTHRTIQCFSTEREYLQFSWNRISWNRTPRTTSHCQHASVFWRLFFVFQCDTMRHMKTITIRELHENTGQWVRKASAAEVYVTERGRLVAKIVPASPPPAKPFFANPRFTRVFLAQRKHLRGGTDSTLTISDERDHEIE